MSGETGKMHLNIISTHKFNSLFTQQRKYKIETEVENWIQKYDSDMGERQVK